MKRVVHLCCRHYALDTRVYERECRSLSLAGFEVHLVAPEPPGPAQDGVHFHAVPRVEGALPIGGGLRSLNAACRIARALDGSVVHLHEPMTIPAGLHMRLKGKRVVYDVHEEWPQQAMVTARNRRRPLTGAFLCASWFVLEHLARLCFSGFVCATPHIAGKFPRNRTCVARNLPTRDLLGELEPEMRGSDYRSRKPSVIFVGNLTRSRGGHEIVDAMARLPASLGAELVIAGDCVPGSFREELERRPGWARCRCLGWVDRRRVLDELTRSRLGLLLFQDMPNHRFALPNKLFEYMAAGLPVVASDLPGWRDIVTQQDCGVLVDPLDAGAVAKAMEGLLRDPAGAEAMGRRGRRAVEEELNWEREVGTLLDLYGRLCPASE